MDISETKVKREMETVLPLVNIVFLLLIFFMIAGTFTQVELFNITPPSSSLGAQAEKHHLTIIMNKEREYAIADKAYNATTLSDFLKTERIKAQNTGKQPLTVQLKVDQDLEAQYLLNTMEMLAATGLESVQLITRFEK